MPELKDRRWEQYARLRATGETQSASYSRAGFREDRKNASKFDSKPEIQGRIAELIAEAALLNPEDLKGKTSAEKLEMILDHTIRQKNWAVAVNAAKAMADGDGSLEAMASKSSAAAMTDDELIATVLPVFKNYEMARGLKQRPDSDIMATMRAMLRNSFDPDPEPAAPEAAKENLK